MHQDLVLYTARGVARELDILAQIIGVYRLDEPDCTYGYKILLTAAVLIILFDDVRDKAQIVLYEDVARGDIAMCGKLQIMLLLSLFQGLREAVAPRYVQDEQEDVLTYIR